MLTSYIRTSLKIDLINISHNQFPSGDPVAGYSFRNTGFLFDWDKASFINPHLVVSTISRTTTLWSK